jgi:catechol 2,3-dioxygenase
VEAGIQLDGAADHGVSEALYLRDPDDNGVELYRDRSQDEWPRNAEGHLQMFTRPLDVRALLHEAHAARLEKKVEIGSTGPNDLA